MRIAKHALFSPFPCFHFFLMHPFTIKGTTSARNFFAGLGVFILFGMSKELG